MLQNKQKMYVHIYCNAAELGEANYRDLIEQHTGCRSAKDPCFSQLDFDRAMAALETILFERVDAGKVQNPIGHSRWIRARTYWRDRLGHPQYINTRQSKKIEDLWANLAPTVGFKNPHSAEALGYLLRIVRKATGQKYEIDAHLEELPSLSSVEASHLIDALKDRLFHRQVFSNCKCTPVSPLPPPSPLSKANNFAPSAIRCHVGMWIIASDKECGDIPWDRLCVALLPEIPVAVDGAPLFLLQPGADYLWPILS